MNILALTSRFPVFFVVITLTILLIHNIRRSDRIIKKKQDEYWTREITANSTRRKSLDTVDYIVIPYNDFPMELEYDDPQIKEYVDQINELKGHQIANFTGLTNTDLKLEYGAPNITHLTRCDNDFTILARTLDGWAARLHELGHDEEALTILDFAVKCRSDVSSTFYLAARLYSEREDYKKIAWLKRQAESLNSLMSGPILRNLNEKYPDINAYD